MCELVHVAVAAIVNQHNEVLISKRDINAHQGGLWEFPGGKKEDNENIVDALVRECKEELNIRPVAYRPLIKIKHHYEDRSVLLDVWKVSEFNGSPEGLEGQPIKWININDLYDIDLPEADHGICKALQLPDRYLITGAFENRDDFKTRLTKAITNNIQLVQLRLTTQWFEQAGPDVAVDIVKIALDLADQHRFILMLNLPEILLQQVSGLIRPTQTNVGLHFTSKNLGYLKTRPDCSWLSVSCHNSEELKLSQRLGADIVLLSPVKKTKTHPEADALGWKQFSAFIDDINVPVYALGGMSEADLVDAWQAGAQGVAAINTFWNTMV